MATATETTKAPARGAERTPAMKHADDAKTLEYLQHAIDDLDRAREHADKELRSGLGTAMARMREIAGDVRRRAQNNAAESPETTEDRARAGDSIEVKGLPGRTPRRGQILEVLGRSGHEHYDVRWDEQHTSIFFPTEGMTVIRHHRGTTEHA